MIKSKYISDCVAAIAKSGKAQILGSMKKDAPYSVAKDFEVITAPTLEDLKTLLTERGLTFNETPIRPISQ